MTSTVQLTSIDALNKTLETPPLDPVVLAIANDFLSGKSISEIGVVTDIVVEESGERFIMNTKTDNQLNYAIKLLNG